MSNTEEEWMNRTLDTSLDDTESINTVKIFDADSIDDLPSMSEEYIGDEEDDSIISEDLLSNDLEKTNACVAAFTIVFIFYLPQQKSGRIFILFLQQGTKNIRTPNS